MYVCMPAYPHVCARVCVRGFVCMCLCFSVDVKW